MSAVPKRKLNPIEQKAEKEVYKEWIKEADTTKGKIKGFTILGVVSLAIFLIQKHTAINIDSLAFYFLTVIFLSVLMLLYGSHAFRIKKKHHYLKILKTGSYGDKKLNSSSSLKNKKSFQEAHKLFLQEWEDSAKITLWEWIIIIPVSLLALLALATEYTNINNVLKTTDVKLIAVPLMTVAFFGWLVAIIAEARKGRIYTIRGR